jgi:hypothetical protein
MRIAVGKGKIHPDFKSRIQTTPDTRDAFCQNRDEG